MNKYFIYILTFSLLYSKVNAQQFQFTNLGVNDGLSQSSVLCIFQDSKGFMWFGTGDGLNRYDGHKFTVFKHNDADSFSISNNCVRQIIEDSKGHLWIGTDAGLNEYIPEQNKIVPYLNEELTSVLPLINRLGKVWFWVNGYGMANIDIKSKRIKTYFNSIKNSGVVLMDFEFNTVSNNFILASNIGMLHFNTVSSTKYYISTDFKVQPYYIIQSNSKQKKYWFSNGSEITFVDSNSNIFEKHNSFSKSDLIKGIATSQEDNEGNIWFGSYGKGLYLYNWYLNSFQNLNIVKEENQRLIKSLFKDRDGNIWVGTDGKGILMYSPRRYKFAHFSTSNAINPQKISANFIKCFGEIKENKILVATHQKGVNIFDPIRNTNTITYKYGKTISVIYKSKANENWIIADGKLTKYDNELLNPQAIVFPKKKYFYYPICVCVDDKGNTWIGCSTGLYIYNVKSQIKFIEGSDSFTFYSIYQDKDKKIWLATALELMTIERGKLVKIRTKHPLVVRSFLEHNSKIWMAGPKGLFSYDKCTFEIRQFGIKNGLPDLMLYGILIDKKNNLWISSNKGLSSLNTNSYKIRNYDLNDGLQSYEYNTGAYFKASTGTMYFGGINGFNFFNPEEITDDPHSPKTVLTSIKLFDVDMDLTSEISCIKQVILNHDQNILSFEFASLQFTDVSRNQYAYRMEGIDTGWVFSGTKNFARYANLASGNYNFKVKSCNSDGVWSNKVASLLITIKTPWWKQWWFMLLEFISIGLVFILIAKFIIQRKLEEQKRIIEKQKAVEDERSRISKDMHDDLGSGLSKIAIMSELLKANIVDEKDTLQVQKISQTAHELVDSMSQIIWSMNPENDNIENILGYLRKFSFDFFENSNICCTVNFPENIIPIQLSQFKRRNLFLVIKESFHNVIKHANASKVNIDAILNDNKFKITIADDGKGFDIGEKKFSGNGLKNMQKRMFEIDGTYSLISYKGDGTKTVLELTIQ